MRDLFLDKSLQSFYKNNGYVVLDFLNNSEIHSLTEFYKKRIDNNKKEDIYESSRDNNPESNNLIQSKIYTAFERSFKKYFYKEHQFFGGTYMVKTNMQSTLLPLHQDWSIIDESKFDTVFIWCPLVDIRIENGGLFVLEKSHTFFNNYRSGSMPAPRIFLNNPFKKLIKSINLNAGQAIAYSPNLFHGSYPNNTDKDRLVVNGQVIEKGADLLYYKLSNGDNTKVEVYRMTPESYLNEIQIIDKGGIPRNARLIKTLINNNINITNFEVKKKILMHLFSKGYAKKLIFGND